jgi:hypothetical protein
MLHALASLFLRLAWEVRSLGGVSRAIRRFNRSGTDGRIVSFSDRCPETCSELDIPEANYDSERVRYPTMFPKEPIPPSESDQRGLIADQRSRAGPPASNSFVRPGRYAENGLEAFSPAPGIPGNHAVQGS